MKTLKGFMAHLRRNPIFAEDFSDRNSVFDQFAKADDSDIKLCFAAYFPGDYCGDATVFYYRKSTKKYYEAYGSHCSCYGLEGQWEGSEEMFLQEMENRLINGRLRDGNIFKDAFEKWKLEN